MNVKPKTKTQPKPISSERAAVQQRLAAIQSVIRDCHAQLDDRKANAARGSNAPFAGNSAASRPRPDGASKRPQGGKGLLRVAVGQHKVGGIGDRRPPPSRNERPASSVEKKTLKSQRSLSHIQVLAPLPGEERERRVKQSGIVRSYQHHGALKDRVFSYHSKQFLDEQGEVVRGSEYYGLATGNLTTTMVLPGTIIKTLQLNPQFLRNTKLYTRSLLYNRFRFKEFIVEYEPAVASTVGGELSFSATLDPTENPGFEVPNGDSAIRRMMGYTDNTVFNSYTHNSLHVTFSSSEEDWFYLGTSEDPRFESQGEIFMNELLGPSTPAATPVNYGTLKIHYEVEFCGAVIDTAPVTSESVALLSRTTGTITVDNPVKFVFSAAAAAADTIYISGSSIPVAGVVMVEVIGVPSDPNSLVMKEPGQGAISRSLIPGVTWYLKPTNIVGEYRAFQSLPSLMGNAAEDDDQLVWGSSGPAPHTMSVRVTMIAAVNDPQI